MVVKVNGLGSYTIQCQCPAAGVEETRGVQIPDPGIIKDLHQVYPFMKKSKKK
jgi:hypothetical protein